MPHMLNGRRLLIMALLCLAVAPAAAAQTSGLLLGLRWGDDAPPTASAVVPFYRTLWIAPAAGKLGVVATIPTLVVPQDDGFWRVDIETSCSIMEVTLMGQESRFLDHFQTAVWRPLGSPRTFAHTGDRMDCADGLAQLLKQRTDTSDSGEEPCNIGDVTVNHASAKVVSYRTYTAHTEFCSPDRYTSSTRLTVLPASADSARYFAFPGDSVMSLLSALPPARAAALEKKWSSGRSDCTFEESPDANWGIGRGVGEWIAEFSSTGPTVCRGEGMSEFDIHERIPATLARSEPREWLARIRRVVPVVDDYFVSPRADVVGIRSGDRLSFYSTRGPAIDKLLLQHTLRPRERVILVEWATGAHVERWTRELAR